MSEKRTEADAMNELRVKAERENAALREENARLTRERDLAIAHDRQPYPTAHAYEQVCNARTNWQQRAERAEADRDRHAAASKAQNEDITALMAELAAVRPIAKFGALCFADHRSHMSELDGGWLHDKCVDLGLLDSHEVTAASWDGCGSVYCECEVGDTCYTPSAAGHAAIDAAAEQQGER